MQEGQMLHNSPGHEAPKQTQNHHRQRHRCSYLVTTIHPRQPLIPAHLTQRKPNLALIRSKVSLEETRTPMQRACPNRDYGFFYSAEYGSGWKQKMPLNQVQGHFFFKYRAARDLGA